MFRRILQFTKHCSYLSLFTRALVLGAFISAPLSLLLAEKFPDPRELIQSSFPDHSGSPLRTPLYLTETERRALEERLGFSVKGRFYTFYLYKRGEQVLGTSFLDTRTIRTKEGSFFMTFGSDGALRDVQVVSFREPEDYLPLKRWLKLFQGKSSPDLAISGKDIPAVTGATLTSSALSRSVRLGLALNGILGSRSR